MHCHPAALSIGWQAYVLSLLTVASDYSWALVFCCLACLGTAWHLQLSLIVSTCWLCGIVSWNLGPLPDCLALPLDQLIAWHWLPTALSICWMACIASLLSSRSDCTWALALRCPVSRSECLASPSCWVHLLTLRNCSSAAWHTCCLVLLYRLAECLAFSSCLFTASWLQCPLAALWVCLLTGTCSFAVLSTCFYAWPFYHIVLPTCLDFISKYAPVWKN